MSDQEVPELDYQTVRRRVVRRFMKRLWFAADVFLWLLFLLSDGPNFSMNGDGPVAIFWFLVLVVHFVYAFEIWGRMMDRMTQREIEALQRKGYQVAPPTDTETPKAARHAKQKRDQVARLSDDGEIIFDEPPQAAEPPRVTSRHGKRNQG